MEFPVGSRVSAMLWSIELKLQHTVEPYRKCWGCCKAARENQWNTAAWPFYISEKQQEDHVFQIIFGKKKLGCLQKKTCDKQQQKPISWMTFPSDGNNEQKLLVYWQFDAHGYTNAYFILIQK